MRRLWIPHIAALAGLLTAGCAKPADGGGEPDSDSASEGAPDSDAPGGGDSERDDGGDSEDTAPPAEDAYFAGVVLSPEGAPAEGIYVTLCSGGCLTMLTDAEGTFALEGPFNGDVAVHVQDVSGALGWADVLVITAIAPGEVVTLDTPFAMGALGQVTPMSGRPAAEVEVVDGLWLTVDPAAVSLPFGEEALDLAGAAAPSFPPLLPVDDALAVWYLAPFEARSESPMATRIENRWGLEPGQTLTLYEASKSDLAWLPAGEVTVSEDGGELVGGAVTVLSTLVLAP